MSPDSIALLELIYPTGFIPIDWSKRSIPHNLRTGLVWNLQTYTASSARRVWRFETSTGARVNAVLLTSSRMNVNLFVELVLI